MSFLDEISDKYFEAIYDTDHDEAMRIIEESLVQGITAEEAVFNIILPSMERMITGLLENDQATLSQHFVASKIAAEIVESLIPKFREAPKGQGTIIIGTPVGDFHGLGKKIVSGCLKANMFTVMDIGLNNEPEDFVDAAVKNNASVIGISTMMMHTATSEKGAIGVREILKRENLEEKIKIVVGGAPYKFDSKLYLKVNADAWAPDALRSVDVMVNLIKEVQHD